MQSLPQSDTEFLMEKKLLNEVYVQCDEQLRSKFKRSLPFQDGLFDRWERAQRLGFGNGSSIYNSSCIFDKVIVGKNTWIGPFTILDGMGGELIIGDGCAISAGVQIYTHDTILRTLSGGHHEMHRASVKIGNYCQIAPNAIIAAGVTIGSHCIVAANSFVNKSFGNNIIIGGTPARKLGDVMILPDNSIRLVYAKKIGWLAKILKKFDIN